MVIVGTGRVIGGNSRLTAVELAGRLVGMAR
jgi:hypothetical protein